MTAELRIVSPVAVENSEVPAVRFNENMTVVVSVALDEPWFKAPSMSRRTAPLDGETDGWVFETIRPGEPVRALVSGYATSKDTGKDDPSGPPVRAGSSAGLGVQVTVKSGGLELCYSHLKRGSAKSGQRVSRGDAIGATGNTGRCAGGERQGFLRISGKRDGVRARLEEFTEPIVLFAFFNEQPFSKPLEFPQGEVEAKSLSFEPVWVNPEAPDAFRRGPNELEVVARRGTRTLASRRALVTIDY
ncbi:MAG TPA: M23 family metallopeptidase [Planctomycetota bacterium]|nr:M23 family metallopeptidase [Planctomycetota bacterium]